MSPTTSSASSGHEPDAALLEDPVAPRLWHPPFGIRGVHVVPDVDGSGRSAK